MKSFFKLLIEIIDLIIIIFMVWGLSRIFIETLDSFELFCDYPCKSDHLDNERKQSWLYIIAVLSSVSFFTELVFQIYKRNKYERTN